MIAQDYAQAIPAQAAMLERKGGCDIFDCVFHLSTLQKAPNEMTKELEKVFEKIQHNYKEWDENWTETRK
ncbi:hypothetical protein LA080_008062 [Diaporthe eres]|nr:hypothetical protein LA080_008062 [Diaporthe eres]